uniref:Uncharacterized protein n=1 Tax=Lutzomyia longipalpis TaxID=7200 RepID=A0A7G3B2V8_LUTLO
MLGFSAAFVSPNNSRIFFRSSVTVTVTIAPAVTTLVCSSSITSQRKLKSMRGIFPRTFMRVSYSKSLRFLRMARLSSAGSCANCWRFFMWRFFVAKYLK